MIKEYSMKGYIKFPLNDLQRLTYDKSTMQLFAISYIWYTYYTAIKSHFERLKHF